jgi:hypothetical protein
MLVQAVAIPDSDSCRGQLDIFIKSEHKLREPHDWKDVEVVGKLQVSSNSWREKPKQLGRYMRNVFVAQPTRRFIHGLTLLGTTMEVWVFVCSDAYSSDEFDIQEKPERSSKPLQET